MNKWAKLRAWANKNDGRYFKVENQKFNVYEVTGYLLIITAIVVYLFVEKTQFKESWLGWLALLVGLMVLFIGIVKKVKND